MTRAINVRWFFATLLAALTPQVASANSLIAFDSHNRAIGYYQGTCGSFADNWKIYR
jgi:hypothetical protein